MIKILFFVGLIASLYFLAKRAMTPNAGMGKGEAAKLLGVATDAGSDAVIDAHRRLIARVHPDAGGNAELAARINRARDTMLKP